MNLIKMFELLTASSYTSKTYASKLAGENQIQPDFFSLLHSPSPSSHTSMEPSCRHANGMCLSLFLLAGQLAVGTCEIVMLNRDSSLPRRTIARQTARCACRRGQIAGTTRARPACVDGKSGGLPLKAVTS